MHAKENMGRNNKEFHCEIQEDTPSVNQLSTDQVLVSVYEVGERHLQ